MDEYKDNLNKKNLQGRSFSPKYSSDGEGNKIEKRGDQNNSDKKEIPEEAHGNNMAVTDKISHRIVGGEANGILNSTDISPENSFKKTGDDNEPDRCQNSVLRNNDQSEKVRLIAAREII